MDYLRHCVTILVQRHMFLEKVKVVKALDL